MDLSLKSKTRRLIEQKLRSGKYASAEDVVQAGLAALRQQEAFGDFAPGELDELLRAGERSVKQRGTVVAAEVFADLRGRSQRRRHVRKAG